MRKNNNVTDTDLVIMYQSGDKMALAILVKRWHLKFCKIAFWIVKDADASKDIAQECWSVIMFKVKDLKEPNKFKSWAISIVNRKSIDWLRTKNREKNKLLNFYNENPKDQINVEIDKYHKLKLLLMKSINNLSVEQQEVINLFYTQKYRLKEISEILDISVGTAKSRLFHAREKLKTIFKNQEL